MVVFTCGHSFPKKLFFETILPEFKLRVLQFPIPIPTSLNLILSEYHQPFMNAACPKCVYNFLIVLQPPPDNNGHSFPVWDP